MSKAVGRDELVVELERLADNLEKTPTVSDVRDHARFSYQPYYATFDSFDDALAEADLEREPRQQGPSKDELLDAIRELAGEVDGTPTRADMNRDGRFSAQPYYNKFDGWNDAVEQANLETNHDYYSDEELIDELQRIAEVVGRSPTFDEFNEHSDLNASACAERFGTWLSARKAAGLSGIGHAYGQRLNPDDLLDELERLGNLFGRAPTQQEINEFGCHWHTAYYDHFGDLETALEKAGFDLDDSSRDWPDDYPNDWLDRAEAVRERDGYECVAPDCDMGQAEHKREYNQKLHVHHVATDGGDPNALENLVTMCASCHKKWDRVKTDPRTSND